MFATALGAPIAVFHLQDNDTQVVAEAQIGAPGKAVTTALREAPKPGGAPEASDQPLATLLSEGTIVPGVGIGSVMLDTDVQEVLQKIQEPSQLTYAYMDTGVEGRHDVLGPDFRLTITADSDLGQINAVALSTLDCAGLRTFQPRQNGLPATSEGLSLGSHVSRVRTTLGAPDSQSPVSAGRQPRVEHSYPGLRLSYCAQDMLVGGIKIERLPPAPLIASAGVPDPAIETPDLTDVLIASVEHQGQQARTSAEMAALEPSRLAPAALPDPVEVPAGLSTKPELADPLATEPTALLAMNGSAFTAGDAFSLSREKRESGIIARSSPPSAMFLAAARATVAEEARDEFEGVGEFLLANAESSEEALSLSRTGRGTIQRRLQLIGYDPKGVDGIFGPNTRKMISALQLDEGLPTTGFLDEGLMAMIENRSAPAFGQWEKRVRIAQAKARRAAARRAAEERAKRDIVIARVPAPRNAPECARDQSGTIISNQSFQCDVTVLEESLNNLFSGQS
ncbi:MAG: peptidoglycan-binding domain-containing protein [Pseudomonadota bacterium]